MSKPKNVLIKGKKIGVRGIDPKLYNKLVAFVRYKYEGKTYGVDHRTGYKGNFIAKEMNAAIEDYLESGGSQQQRRTQTQKIKILKDGLKQIKKIKGGVDHEDINMMVAAISVNERTGLNYLWRLKADGFFEELGIDPKLPPLIKFEVLPTDTDEKIENIIRVTSEAKMENKIRNVLTNVKMFYDPNDDSKIEVA